MLNRFQKLALATTATTYLLILVGALVRASGAGMGCPDWPRCFERWIPPTELAQVPPLLAARFNVEKAWIEYLNRLLGTTTGLLVLATLIAAWVYYRRAPRVLYASMGAFVCVGLAGWLGKKVVDQNLRPAMVTLHMFVALATVALLIQATVCAFSPDGRFEYEPSPARRRTSALALALAGVTMVQVGLGTRVRGALDTIGARALPPPRASWLSYVGTADTAHRALAPVVLAACVGLALYVRRVPGAPRTLRAWSDAVALLAVAQVAAGVGLAYAALPPPLQVAHVTLASALLGALVVVALVATRWPDARPAT